MHPGQQFLQAVRDNNLDEARRLLQLEEGGRSVVDPTAQDNEALRTAFTSNHVEMAEMLINDQAVQDSLGGAANRISALMAFSYRTTEQYLLAHKVLNDAVTTGNVGLFKFLVATVYRDARFAFYSGAGCRVSIDQPYSRAMLSAMSENGLLSVEDHLQPLLSSAINANSTETVRLLLDLGVNPTVHNNGAIRQAATWGPVGIDVLRLLLADPRVNPCDDNNRAIAEAIEFGRREAVVELLRWRGPNGERVDPTARDNYGIQWAYRNNKPEAIELILADERVINSVNGQTQVIAELFRLQGDAQIAYGNTQVIIAARHGYTGLLQLLVQLQNKQNNIFDVTAQDNAAIQAAALNGHTAAVRILLACRTGTLLANPACNNNEPLRSAAVAGHTEVVRLLLADNRVNPADQNNAAIISAASSGHAGVVNALIANNRVDPTAQDNEAFVRAASNGHADVVRLLLQDTRDDEHKANPTARNDEALKAAARNGHAAVVKLLLTVGRVEVTVNNDQPLREAARNGHKEVVAVLLASPRSRVPDDIANLLGAQGLNLIANNTVALTFNWAAQNGYSKLATVMLNWEHAGQRVVNPTTNHNEAIHVAAKHGHTAIVELLLKDHWVAFTLFFENKEAHLGFGIGSSIVLALVVVEQLTNSNLFYNPIQVALGNDAAAIATCASIAIAAGILTAIAAHFLTNRGLEQGPVRV